MFRVAIAALLLSTSSALSMSATDLILDQKKLAGSVVSVSGTLRDYGVVEVLYPNLLDATQENDNFFPLLLDDADRPLRAALMRRYDCRTRTGCGVRLVGRVSECESVAGTVLCLVVQSGELK